MPGWAVVLFWIWFAVSLVLFILRRVKARRGELEGGGLLGRPSAAAANTTEPVEPTAKEWPAPPPPDPDDDTFRLESTESPPTPASRPGTDTGTGTDTDTIAAETADIGRAADPVPLATTGAPAPDGPVPTGSATLPELLAGITLPHELVPLTQLDANVDVSTRVIVATEKAGAEEVRRGLVDELERLGYTVEHATMLQLIATGERGRVFLDIHADGPAVTDGGICRFPTAPEGSVVVEIRAG